MRFKVVAFDSILTNSQTSPATLETKSGEHIAVTKLTLDASQNNLLKVLGGIDTGKVQVYDKYGKLISEIGTSQAVPTSLNTNYSGEYYVVFVSKDSSTAQKTSFELMQSPKTIVQPVTINGKTTIDYTK